MRGIKMLRATEQKTNHVWGIAGEECMSWVKGLDLTVNTWCGLGPGD